MILSQRQLEEIAASTTKDFKGVFWSGGDNTRIPGKMQFHYRLAFGGDGRPMLQTFSTCRHFIRTIPALVYDETRVEDINTEMEDHIYDECRYVLMENPIAPRACRKKEVPAEDPLDLFAEKKVRFLRI